MSRYDYVKYDEASIELQAATKSAFEEISEAIEIAFKDDQAAARSAALAQTKLEEAYMWVGKAIRDSQLGAGRPTEPQEERTNS